MDERQYYSMRTGKNSELQRIDLERLKQLFLLIYNKFLEKCYFQESFGYHCVDEGDVSGAIGSDLEAAVFLRLRRNGLWPIRDNIGGWQEHDLFDMIEFLHDEVSKPEDGQYHSFSNCGWHYWSFDKETGQSEFRSELNPILRDYSAGYLLSEEGEVHSKPLRGTERLIEAPIPATQDGDIDGRVKSAIRKFTHHGASIESRRDALRDLVDVLEFLRPRLKKVLDSRDEKDLFNIANNFGIRHHNERQKLTYDRPIWFSWMFYYYLASIHAGMRLIEKHGSKE